MADEAQPGRELGAMARYIEFVIRARWLVLVLFGAVTAFFGYHVLQIKLSTNPQEIFFGESPAYERYADRSEQFGGDAIIFIGLEDDDLLAPATLERLARVAAAIAAHPKVDRVAGLTDAQLIRGTADELVIERYADLLRADPSRRDELLRVMTTDPLTRGWLITPDGRHTTLLVQLVPDRSGTAESVPDTLRAVFAAFAAEGFAAERLQRGGFAANLGGLLEEAGFVLTILPITTLVLLLAVYLMFRRLWPVVFTGAITGVAVTWAMGLAVLVYDHINLLTTMVPGLILITCFADVVHLCSAYLLELSAGHGKDAAIRRIGKEVGTACGYTSVTTFCGFVSMTLVPTPVFKQLGLLMGFGVAVALFLALTLVPIFLTLMRPPRPWKVGGGSRVHDVLDGVLARVDRLTRDWPRAVVALFAVLLALALAGLVQVNFETQLSERFHPDHPLRQGRDYFARHFPGTNPLDVYVETAEIDGLLDPDLFARIAELEAFIEAQPRVNQAVSPVDVVRRLYSEYNPALAREAPLPASRAALAQLFLLFEMSGGEDLERLIDEERRTMRLNGRLQDLGVIETAAIGDAIQAHGRALLGDAATVETYSLNYLLGDWLDETVAGQQRGLLFALATITVMMIVALRSVRSGLLSMIPNALPLLCLLGYLGWVYNQVDTDTMAVMMVAVGIGVDDTIHFLLRLKLEGRKVPDAVAAVGRTFHYSGRAIVITTVILVAGFAPFAWSDYQSVEMFGTLLPASLVAALAADLLLVPAMVRLGWLRFRRPA